MNHYNMITGEPESPPSGNYAMSEQEVIQNANLMGTFQGGGYYYDTNSRMISMGGNSGFSNYMNAPANVSGNSIGNPAFALLEEMKSGAFQNPYYQAPQIQDQIITIPGFNPGGGDMILPEGIEDIKKKLQLEMMAEQDLAYEEKIKRQREFYQKTGYATNYYGMPYISYDDPAVMNKYRKIVGDIREQAIRARQDLNKKLSAFAHNYIEGEYDEEKIADLYNERTIVIPSTQVENDRQEAFFASMVETPNNAAMYRQAHAKVSEEHDRYFGKNNDGKVDLDLFLEGASVMKMEDELNEEQRRRRDMSALYNQNGGYRSLIKSSLMERRRRENGESDGGFANSDNPFTLPTFQAFPTLMNSGKMMDDGSITISPPDSIYTGNMNPQVIMNEQERKYQRSRDRFIQCLYQDESIPGGVV